MMPIGHPKAMWRNLVAKLATSASVAIWWPDLEPMQVAPPDDQILNKCKWCHLVAQLSANPISSARRRKQRRAEPELYPSSPSSSYYEKGFTRRTLFFSGGTGEGNQNVHPMRVLDSWNRSSEANPPYLPIIGGIKQMVLKTEYILGLRISIPLDGSCWSVLALSELIPVNTRQPQCHRKTE